MQIDNTHQRELPISADQAEFLLATLAGPHDRLWPYEKWPPVHFPDGLRPGSTGGHGPIGYRVESLAPRQITFQFTRPQGYHGRHELLLEETGESSCRLTHRLSMRADFFAWLAWSLVIRWLHDALLEDLLDKAYDSSLGQSWRPRQQWSLWVQIGRRLVTALTRGITRH